MVAKKSRMEIDFADESEESDVVSQQGGSRAVVSGADWTTETIVGQLRKNNIQLNPKFQRRDAWKRDRKGRFIESLIMGLPIPQIVLAESATDPGKFIVLDGKQRLLSIAQFWGEFEGENNGFSLTGLTLRKDLKKKTFADLESDPDLEADLNSLSNQTIRTIVIRNWPNSDFLHTVFLRLNTGSVNLSPQELRQALQPGDFSDFIDNAAAESTAMRDLLGVDQPDPRMRDVEILARFLAFRFFSSKYPGRMKKFLDDTFEQLNKSWRINHRKVREACDDFEAGVTDLMRIFEDDLARKPGSAQFNRAIFDALIYYQSQEKVRKATRTKKARMVAAYKKLFADDSEFSKAIESDTAGAPNTSARLRIWGKEMSKISGIALDIPVIPRAATTKRTAERALRTKKDPIRRRRG